MYQFFRRHVYSPMRSRGWSHKGASLLVFLLSAILHELLVGVPTHNLIGESRPSEHTPHANHSLITHAGVAFLGMFLQLPLIQITLPLERMKSAHGRLLGNIIFWVSFTILGQPFAALMYFYAWQAKYGSVSKAMTHGQPATCPPV